MRLLLVEDEYDFAHALAKGLRHQGYAVDVAADGIQVVPLYYDYSSTNTYFRYWY